MATLNATHDPARKSWIESANRPDTDFPIQNLPFGVFRTSDTALRGGISIGDQIVDIPALLALGALTGEAVEVARAASGPTLNPLMALGNDAASALRHQISDLLRADGPDSRRLENLKDKFLVPMQAATLELPAAIGSFTDFLCSIHHTRRMSPSGDIPPAFKSLPIAYHSRATSVCVSGEPIRRPNGQYKTADGETAFGPEPAQDFELELGAFIGPGNALGQPISVRDASQHIFGFCLVNDWSARSIQRWESQPLGPFLSKSMSTTISPWIVTAEAMGPFRASQHVRDQGDKPLAYLNSPEDQASGGLDIQLECTIMTPEMKRQKRAPAAVTRTNAHHSYWTFAQMLVHHASNGCNLQPGDLLGSGTLSGPTDDSRACLAELSRRGTASITLSNGETRMWLQDGDEVVFRGRASRPGFVSIGFGECKGRIEPAVSWPS